MEGWARSAQQMLRRRCSLPDRLRTDRPPGSTQQCCRSLGYYSSQGAVHRKCSFAPCSAATSSTQSKLLCCKTADTFTLVRLSEWMNESIHHVIKKGHCKACLHTKSEDRVLCRTEPMYRGMVQGKEASSYLDVCATCDRPMTASTAETRSWRSLDLTEEGSARLARTDRVSAADSIGTKMSS